MKTISFILFVCCSVLSFGQSEEKKHEFYFNLDLDNHKNEQLFHVDANGGHYQFALIGIIKEGHKQFLVRRYTLKKIEFLIRNFKNAPQEIKLDSVIFTKMTNDTTYLSVFTSKLGCGNDMLKKNQKDWYSLDVGKIGLRKTIIDITMFYDPKCNGLYRKMNTTKRGFGDHICKSRITF